MESCTSTNRFRRASVQPVPLIHRWVAGAGLVLGVGWLISHPLAVDIAESGKTGNVEPFLTAHALVPVVSFLFLLLGLVCEVILGAVVHAKERRDDRERLDELSGRIRFRRPKVKVKQLPVDWIGPLPPPRRQRVRRMRESGADPW